MMVSLLMHICVTCSQWVIHKSYFHKCCYLFLIGDLELSIMSILENIHHVIMWLHCILKSSWVQFPNRIQRHEEMPADTQVVPEGIIALIHCAHTVFLILQRVQKSYKTFLKNIHHKCIHDDGNIVKKVWRTDRQTDRQTENTIHRAAWSQLKTDTFCPSY